MADELFFSFCAHFVLFIDLMLPGVEVKVEPGPRMFGNLQKGDLCVIRLKGNK